MNLGPNTISSTYQFLLNQNGDSITLGNGNSVNWNSAGIVTTTGNQTISGNKTFNNGVFNVETEQSYINSSINTIGPEGKTNYIGYNSINYIGTGVGAINNIGNLAFNTIGSGPFNVNSIGSSSNINNFGINATYNNFGNFSGGLPATINNIGEGAVNNFGKNGINYFGKDASNFFGISEFSTGQNSFGEGTHINMFGRYSTYNYFGLQANFNYFGGLATSENYFGDSAVSNYFGNPGTLANYYYGGQFIQPIRLNLSLFSGPSTQGGRRGELRVSGGFLYVCTGVSAGWNRIPLQTF